MSTRLHLLDTPLPGLKAVERNLLGDRRGYLERMFCMQELSPVLPQGKRIEQINHTLTSHAGTVRGLHFQRRPHAEIKFVTCLAGEVFDVAVDLRRNSPTFLQWHGITLSADNHVTFVIPEGFAHGFQTLTPNAEMLYFHTAAYAPEAEGGINATDPTIGIHWPRTITERSLRDIDLPFVSDSHVGLSV